MNQMDILRNAAPEAKEILARLVKKWWLLLIEGILALAVGIYAAAHFGSGFLAVSVFVAVFLLISGVISLYSALCGGAYAGKTLMVALGALRVLGGSILVLVPGMAELALIVIAGASFLTIALNILLAAFRLRKAKLAGWGWMLALGILLTVNAMIIIANPFISIMLISVSVSVELMITGVHSIVTAVQMKKLAKTMGN